MAGIYIHIPFCKSRCKYCDFFSTTMLDRREEYVAALLQEIELRKEEIARNPIQTIYFGGGTPSLIPAPLLSPLVGKIASLNSYTGEMEITLEANPQDLSLEKLRAYRAIGINRLSIGIQSFQDKHLQLLGRRHSAAEAIQAVRWAQEAGFTNISIDLIYGIPSQTMEEWQADIQQALALNVPHISTYNLIFEEGTRLTQMLLDGQISTADEDLENMMYETIVNTLNDNGYIHYEVSNFCKPNLHSRHNSSYWNNTPYVGLGAGAHSYRMLNTEQRTMNSNSNMSRSAAVQCPETKWSCVRAQRNWNISDLDGYITSIQTGVLPQESENLLEKDCYNEKVMLSLRTIWGLDLNSLSTDERAHCLQQAAKYIDTNLLQLNDNHLTASLKGSEILNQIIQDLML